MSLMNKKTIVVAMSGGVDSAVTAALLKKLGHNIIGVTMKLWNGPETPVADAHHGCYGPGEAQDIEDAREVADKLGIPFHVFDLSEEYKSDVLDYFSLEYLSGRTPNPCIRCNRNLKFGTLFRRVEQSGIEFDGMATGHYARLEYNTVENRHLLKKAVDLNKDQSYFLAMLTQEQLAIATFPLGDLYKSGVRKLAEDFGLPVADKTESQDFVAGDYSSILPEGSPGPILDRDGNVLGEHTSIAGYTIGQRRGLGISSKYPMFVVDIAAERNAVIVGPREDLYQDELTASGLNWIAIETLTEPIEVAARVRYRHKEAESIVFPLNNGQVRVKFKEPQLAITPGQTIVFYQGDNVIGAGTIDSPHVIARNGETKQSGSSKSSVKNK